MKYRTKRILALLTLLVGLPIYTVLVVSGMALLGNLPTILELLIYIFLGVIWVFPLKFVFQGVGQSDVND